MKLRKTHQEMDRISNLPQDMIEKILTLMPIRDALRTSILSKKWRYCWKTMPKLKFHVINSPFKHEEFDKNKPFKDIFQVLLLHKGPILEFSIHIKPDKDFANEIDPIIIHLSRNNNIKKFHIRNPTVFEYKLPSSFFSLQGLEQVVLVGCVIKPPLNFNGFSMLRNLVFNNCDFDSKMLQRFLTNCPLLEKFTLDTCFAVSSIKGNSCTFGELFKCLPSVQHLTFYDYRIQNFVDGDMPQKLPTPLVHLRILNLHVCLQHDDLSFVLNLINNSPNLEKIILKLSSDHWICLNEVEGIKNLFDFQDNSDLKLDKLEQLEIRNFQNLAREICFVKLIMAKSPLLKKAQMQLSEDVSVDEEVKMLRDLVQSPFPHASPIAKFIIKR